MNIHSMKTQVLVMLVAGLLLLTSVACTQNQIAAEVQIIGNAGASLATILNNPTLAAKLKTDTADAVAAINAWKSGTPCQNVEQAITLLMTDYNDIAASFGSVVPPNVTALIGLATTTILAVLALMPGCAAPAGLKAGTTAPAKDAKDFKARWNAIANGDPTLKGAVIK